jgi:hypothetical protein
VGDGKDGRKDNIRETKLTTSGIRFVWVPKVFVLECVVIVMPLKRNLKQTVTSRIAQ